MVKDKFGNVWPEPPLSTGARVLQTKQLTFVCPAGTTNAYPGAEIEILGGSWNGTGTVFTATIRNAAGVEASYTAQFTTDFKSLARYAEYLTLEGQERQGLEIYNVPLNTLQSILPSQYVYTLSGEEGIGHVTKAYTSMWMRTGVCSGIDHSKPFFFRLRLVR